MEPVVEPLAPWLTAWPALPALVLLLVGLWRLRGQLRARWELGAILALALLVRVVVVPLQRHEFDGHEAEYLDIFLGDRALTQGGTLLYPAMQWLYRLLGLGPDWPWVLTVFNVGVALVGLAALVGFVGRLSETRVGWAAGVGVALLGNHAAWSSASYNVVLPLSLSLVALWGLAVLIRRGDPLGAGLLAGGAAALAVATRLESVLVAPLGFWLLVAYRPPKVHLWAPGLLAGAGLGAAAAWYITWSGGLPGEGERALAWSVNWPLLVYWAPFDAWLAWPAVVAGLGVSIWKWPRLGVGLLVSVALVQGVMATFDDFGARHVLVGQVLLLGACGGLVTVRWGWPLLAGLVVAAGLELADLNQRYYAPEEAFAETLDPSLPRWSEPDPRCVLICEDSRVVPEDQQKSHFNLLDPAEAARLQAEADCLHWLVGVQDHRWSSRAVRDRAQRIERLYDVQAVAVVERTQDGYVGLVVEVRDRHPRPRLRGTW